jgi:hypothetical protein
MSVWAFSRSSDRGSVSSAIIVDDKVLHLFVPIYVGFIVLELWAQDIFKRIWCPTPLPRPSRKRLHIAVCEFRWLWNTSSAF